MTMAAKQSGAQRFPALEGLRAVGALCVLLTHVGFQSGDAVSGPFAGILARLDVGVALFFVVSGFLLFRPYAVARLEGTPPPGVRTYLWHRALRILPVLWVAVLASALLTPTAGVSWLDYLAVATFVQIYVDGPLVHGLTQMWSLSTEVAFYLLLPVVGRLLTRRGSGRAWVRRTIGLCAAGVPLSAAWMAAVTAAGGSDARVWLPGYVGWFGGGMALATWQAARAGRVVGRSRVDVLLEHPGTLWALALAIYAVVTSTVAGPYDLLEPAPGEAALKNLGYGLVGLLVVAPGVLVARTATNRAALDALSGRIASFLGRISYGVFAYHVCVLVLVERLLGLTTFDGRFWPRLIVTLPLSVLVAAVSFYAMERPVMRWGRRGERFAATGVAGTLGPTPTGPHRIPPAGSLPEPTARSGRTIPTARGPRR